MSSLLSQCSTGTMRQTHVVALKFFHTGTILQAARGRKNNKKSKPPAPPRPEFQRDNIPHDGVNPIVRTERARRQFELERRPGEERRTKGPLASPNDVASRSSRIRRDGGRSGEDRGLARYGRGREEFRNEQVEGSERSHSPSSFHRSVERASRETHRMSRQLDKIKFDNEHEFAGPSSKPWKSKADAEDANSTRDFSEFDRPLTEGAYDAPELKDEFFHPLDPVSPVASAKGKQRVVDSPATSFTSPPLMPGFVSSLQEVLGLNAKPTPIQALSLKHIVSEHPSLSESDSAPDNVVPGAPGWKQYLLASETGSGKSIAYLLPLLQGVKRAELSPSPTSTLSSSSTGPKRMYNPRGLVMAPTHELARQLSVFAKSLLRAEDVKLRVLCASKANVLNATARAPVASPYQTEKDAEDSKKAQMHPVDVVVGTPMKLLEMVRGRGFDAISQEEAMKRAEEQVEQQERARDDEEDADEKKSKKIRRGRDRVVHFGKWRAPPEMGLANVEWVVVDEADVLFDHDFQETTRALLADISAARGAALPASASTFPPLPTAVSPSSPDAISESTSSPTPDVFTYPFNLILTSATIPKTLNTYLERHHPNMLRLASPRLHKLPKNLQTEYVGWTGGNKFADVMRRVRKVWAEDAATSNAIKPGTTKDARPQVQLSKVLVFCNKSAKVTEFAAYLAENGIKSVALTSASEHRQRGSNAHLSGFLKEPTRTRRASLSSSNKDGKEEECSDDVSKHPHVMITTSLLSRGLDFSPLIKHVFIVDEPRNTIDFIHRAGRTGRAGEKGKVVIFGKMSGRGSARTKEVRKRVGALTRA